MKLRLPSRHLPHHTNRHRTATSHTLHSRHHPSLLLRSPHMPKRPIRMTNSKPPCKWSLFLLHLHLPAHRTRPLLRFIPKQRDLKHRSYPPSNPHSNCFRRLRSPMRTNIILRCHSNYQSILSHPLHRPNTSRMSLRGLLSRQPHPNPILCPTLSPTIRNRRPHTSSPHLPSRNRLKQPTRHPLRL